MCLGPRGLNEGLVVPIHADGLEVLDLALCGAGALTVDVFDAQDETPPGRSSPGPREDCGAQVAQVEVARGGGRESSGIRHGLSVRGGGCLPGAASPGAVRGRRTVGCMASFRVPDWLAVFVGGVVGTAARAALDELAKASPAPGLFLSWSTLTVNAVGAFILGALSGWVVGRMARSAGDDTSLRKLRLLVGTGFAGAFTTYGAYIVASVGYAALNGIVEAVSQSLGLLAVGGACAWAGMRVGEWLCGPSGMRPVASEGERA